MRLPLTFLVCVTFLNLLQGQQLSPQVKRSVLVVVMIRDVEDGGLRELMEKQLALTLGKYPDYRAIMSGRQLETGVANVSELGELAKGVGADEWILASLSKTRKGDYLLQIRMTRVAGGEELAGGEQLFQRLRELPPLMQNLAQLVVQRARENPPPPEEPKPTVQEQPPEEPEPAVQEQPPEEPEPAVQEQPPEEPEPTVQEQPPEEPEPTVQENTQNAAVLTPPYFSWTVGGTVSFSAFVNPPPDIESAADDVWPGTFVRGNTEVGIILGSRGTIFLNVAAGSLSFYNHPRLQLSGGVGYRQLWHLSPPGAFPVGLYLSGEVGYFRQLPPGLFPNFELFYSKKDDSPLSAQGIEAALGVGIMFPYLNLGLRLFDDFFHIDQGVFGVGLDLAFGLNNYSLDRKRN